MSLELKIQPNNQTLFIEWRLSLLITGLGLVIWGGLFLNNYFNPCVKWCGLQSQWKLGRSCLRLWEQKRPLRKASAFGLGQTVPGLHHSWPSCSHWTETPEPQTSPLQTWSVLCIFEWALLPRLYSWWWSVPSRKMDAETDYASRGGESSAPCLAHRGCLLSAVPIGWH